MHDVNSQQAASTICYSAVRVLNYITYTRYQEGTCAGKGMNNLI